MLLAQTAVTSKDTRISQNASVAVIAGRNVYFRFVSRDVVANRANVVTSDSRSQHFEIFINIEGIVDKGRVTELDPIFRSEIGPASSPGTNNAIAFDRNGDVIRKYSFGLLAYAEEPDSSAIEAYLPMSEAEAASIAYWRLQIAGRWYTVKRAATTSPPRVSAHYVDANDIEFDWNAKAWPHAQVHLQKDDSPLVMVPGVYPLPAPGIRTAYVRLSNNVTSTALIPVPVQAATTLPQRTEPNATTAVSNVSARNGSREGSIGLRPIYIELSGVHSNGRWLLDPIVRSDTGVSSDGGSYVAIARDLRGHVLAQYHFAALPQLDPGEPALATFFPTSLSIEKEIASWEFLMDGQTYTIKRTAYQGSPIVTAKRVGASEVDIEWKATQYPAAEVFEGSTKVGSYFTTPGVQSLAIPSTTKLLISLSDNVTSTPLITVPIHGAP